MDQIHVTPELIILGGGAATILEFLRALILKIEDYPRVAATWKYYPYFLGALLINFFPSIVPNTSLLMLWAHGAASPVVWALAYPAIKKTLEGTSLLPKALGGGAEVLKLEQKPKVSPTPKEGTP